MSPLGNIFEGEQMDGKYKWGRAKFNRQQQNAEGDLSKFKGPNLVSVQIIAPWNEENNGNVLLADA